MKNSRLNLGIPMLAYYTAVSGYPVKDRGIIPDHSIRPSIHDVLAERMLCWILHWN